MTDLPSPVTPGQPVEAIWGNEVVEALTEAINTMNSLLPIGIVALYGGTVQPTNWLFCRGQAISQTTYSELYAVLGAKFNVGLGAPPAGTFRVPNMQGRYPVGVNVGSSSGTGLIDTKWTTGVGECAGDYTPVMPSHQHSMPDHAHDVDILSADPNVHHTHEAPFNFNFFETGFDAQIALNRGTPSIGYYLTKTTFNDDPPHKHRVLGSTAGADRTVGSGLAGGGAQVPPGISYNFVIRAK